MAPRKPKGTTRPRVPAGKSVVQNIHVEFGRETCGVLEVAEQREWLVTSGIGGFASGTVSGNLTRRYHGILVAALQPPVGRTQLVAKLDETARYQGAEYALATNRWVSGTVAPEGYVNIESFRLEGTTPVWRFAFADALLEKRVWMQHGENTTYVQYTLLRANEPLELEIKTLVNYRDFHANTHAGDWRMQMDRLKNGLQITALPRATPFYLLSADAPFEPQQEWYRNFFLSVENYRGLDDRDDYLLAAVSRITLQQNQSITLVFSTNINASLDGAASTSENTQREADLLAQWKAHDAKAAASAPGWIRQLVLAADQFIVKRSVGTGAEEQDGRSIIAGYHWFADWGRDTMIALPGLTLTTGRADIARKILLAFARYVDGGMLPNNFPDAAGKPQYNTVDAGLWFFEAVRQYFAATQDAATVMTLFPVMAQMIDAHIAGTRYRIHVDQSDGLLYAGEPGVQLTWMDAKAGDWVVTPRIGKPVEINALWFNALGTMAELAPNANAKESAQKFADLAARAKQSFAKFWNESAGCCYDVIDTPETGTNGKDASLRPNQIFAVSLPQSPLTPEQQKSVVDICARRLVTSYGLRSLAQREPGYRGHYGGDILARDGAYHQGTVWGWLLGPFVHAHLRVYKDRAAAMSFLEPLGKQIHTHGLGSLSEIFDGDAPFTPRGCIAQAWTVAEVLRAWRAITG
jgi:predicted glycogen debranching enzyme